MALAANDILRVAARMKNSVSGDVMNVWWFQASAAISDSDAVIMTNVSTWLDNVYSAISSMSNTNAPFDYKVDVIVRVSGKPTVTRAIGTSTWVLTTPPAGTTDALPFFCTAVVNYRTAVPQVFARKYLGTWTESAQNANTFVASVVANLSSALTQSLGSILCTGGVLTAGVLSTVRDGPLLDGFHAVTSGVVNPSVKKMGSRAPNVGS